MPEFQLLSPSEQVARHLKTLLGNGRWTGLMPGSGTLEKEFPGVDRKAIGTALQQLVKEGWLEDRGVGKQRKILAKTEGTKLFRIGFMQYDYDGDNRFSNLVDEKFAKKRGVILEHSPNSMVGLKWSLPQITRMVEAMDMDAWIVPAASEEVLEWFVASGLPTYAVFGRHQQLDIDGFSFIHEEAFQDLTQCLLELGHKRISKILRKERRRPVLGNLEQQFFNLLAPAGIRPDSISLPDWDETPEGFHKLLDSLFQFTPPTALILPETYLVHAAFQYFARKGIKVPTDVSIISLEDSETFRWSIPQVTRFYQDMEIASIAISKWADHIQTGTPAQMKKTVHRAQFIKGGTLVAAARR